jgi:hypothetical protein
MLEALQGKRRRGGHLGPTALLEAWEEEEEERRNYNRKTDQNNNRTSDNDDAYFLIEGNAHSLTRDGYSEISKVLKRNWHSLSQKVPNGLDPDCKFSSGTCNFYVIDGADETLYFYSRILGTRWCGFVENHCKYQAV